MTKDILAVIGKFIVLQIAELFIDEAFKYVTYSMKKADVAIVTLLRMLTSTHENRYNRSHFPG